MFITTDQVVRVHFTGYCLLGIFNKSFLNTWLETVKEVREDHQRNVLKLFVTTNKKLTMVDKIDEKNKRWNVREDHEENYRTYY